MHKIEEEPISQSVFAETTEPTKDDKEQYRASYFEIGKYVRRESFGHCYEARKYRAASEVGLGGIFVLKMIDTTDNEELNQQLYINEVRVLKLLKEAGNERFAQLHAHWRKEGNCYIVLERNRYGNLNELMTYLQNFSEVEILYFVREILKAVSVLHSNKILHRNLKLESIAICQNLSIKITDFSLAKIGERQPFENLERCGTPNYLAPEMFGESVAWTQKADIWSIGVILYYLIYLKLPLSEIKQLTPQSLNQIPFPESGSHSRRLIDLVKSIMKVDPLQRPSIKEILQSAAFNQLNDGKIELQILQRLKTYFEQKGVEKSTWKRKVDQIKLQLPCQIVSKPAEVEKVIIEQVISIQKYGYFLLLSNLNVVAFFNNGQIKPFQHRMLFQTNSNQEKILAYIFRTHFKKEIDERVQENEERIYQQPNCTIKKLIVVKDNLFIRLSNQTIQMFFAKQIKNKGKDAQKQDKRTSFPASIYLNYRKQAPKMVKLRHNGDTFVYQSFEKGLKEANGKYFQYVQAVLQQILNNSLISTPQQ